MKLRKYILNRDGYKCLKCGTTLNLTMDHIIPRCYYGQSHKGNLQTLCKLCNWEKGTNIVCYTTDPIVIKYLQNYKCKKIRFRSVYNRPCTNKIRAKRKANVNVDELLLLQQTTYLKT